MADRVAVIGSSIYPTREDVTALVETLPPGTVVISGGAAGPDTWSAAAAKARGLTTVIHWPDLPRHGSPAAYYHRALAIVEDASRIVAFTARDAKTKQITAGAGMIIALAAKAGKPVELNETPVPPRICALIGRANRYLENVAGASTPGELRKRAENVERALAEIGMEIRKLEAKLHAGWDFADALEDRAKAAEYAEPTIRWMNGYERSRDYVDQAGRQLAAARERFPR